MKGQTLLELNHLCKRRSITYIKVNSLYINQNEKKNSSHYPWIKNVEQRNKITTKLVVFIIEFHFWLWSNFWKTARYLCGKKTENQLYFCRHCEQWQKQLCFSFTFHSIITNLFSQIRWFLFLSSNKCNTSPVWYEKHLFLYEYA